MTRSDWMRLTFPTVGSLAAMVITGKIAAWRLRRI